MILLTGATGYLGFHISEMLEEKNIPYLGIDNFSRSSKKNIVNKNKFLKLNIASKKLELIIKQFNITTIIHSAAYSFPPEGERYKKLYFKNNVILTKKFIDICKKNNIKKFIFFSSCNVYKFDNKKVIAVKESSKLSPNNFYGQNKLDIERYILKKNFYNTIILRLFNIGGYINKKKFYEYKNRYRRILPVIVDALNNKKKLVLNMMKNQEKKKIYPARDFVHIKDLLKIINNILIKNQKNKVILNVGTGRMHSIDKLINLFEKKSKKKIKFESIVNSRGNLNYTLANNKKILKYLKINFKYNISDIVKNCIDNKTI